LADYPWPYSIAVAATVVAAGIANVAQIAASKPGGQAHGGIDFVPDQNSTWRLSRGERVLQPAANQDLTRYLREQNDNSGGRSVHLQIVMDGRTLIETIETASRDGRLTIDARSVAP
jgi:hypothetical protein